MIEVIISSWPLDKTIEVVKVAMELPPIPDYISRKMLVKDELGVGTKCFDIYEFDSSKYEEAYDYLNSRIAAFYSVQGFTCEIERWYDEQEAMDFMAKYMSK
jgi:hypothetical protein